ncbi:uncharacterized protein LOC110727248 [Chenopodium quinoa]|uniref:uncharacterized protein LOC110727248 n=1 Tax=Chenopodium quinoa TaxID=63459 RepID=UPI000B77882E|nr:uncharacterized protein LOC110727248 [Chenopodium quinoa]
MAYHDPGCKGASKKMQKMQKICTSYSSASPRLPTDPESFSICSMGTRYLGAISRCSILERWLIVGIDYFGKWIEAEAASNIIAQTLQNIITRFGILKVFVFDHGRQFDNLSLRQYTDQFGTKLAYSVVCHPLSNGQAESANKQILNDLKKRVEDQKSKWIEELPVTLWSLRTTKIEATGHSPFELVYGSEAVLLVEIGTESLRVHHFSVKENEHLLKESLDFQDEVRDLARDIMAAYKQRITKFHNRRVNARPLKIGDLVLRNVVAV